MDQVKIGKFISQCRKEKGLTQAQLAEKLNITDRAVSKWETGKGMPDSSIMIELCDILGICINELFSGEKLHMENYNKKADENLVELKKENEAINKSARAGYIVTIILLLVLNVINVIQHGVMEAISMPAFIILCTANMVWLLFYVSIEARAKKK